MWNKLNIIRYSFVWDSFYLNLRLVLWHILFNNLNSIMILYLSCNRYLVISFFLSILCDLSLTWNFLHSLSYLILYDTSFIRDILYSALGSRSLNSWLILYNTATITRRAGLAWRRTWWTRRFLHYISFYLSTKMDRFFY